MAFFRENRPAVSDSEDFMAKLSARLDEVDASKRYVTVEEVLKLKAEAHKRTRLAVLGSLGVGVAAGACLALSLIFHPVDLQILGLDVGETASAAKQFVDAFGNYIMFGVAALACGLGLLPVIRKRTI